MTCAYVLCVSPLTPVQQVRWVGFGSEGDEEKKTDFVETEKNNLLVKVASVMFL